MQDPLYCRHHQRCWPSIGQAKKLRPMTTLTALLRRKSGGSPSIPPSRVRNPRGRHYAHVDCPGSRRLREDMINRLRPDGRRHFGGGLTDGRWPDQGAHRWPSRFGVPALVVFLNKTGHVDDEEILSSSKLEMRELLDSYDFPVMTP